VRADRQDAPQSAPCPRGVICLRTSLLLCSLAARRDLPESWAQLPMLFAKLRDLSMVSSEFSPLSQQRIRRGVKGKLAGSPEVSWIYIVVYQRGSQFGVSLSSLRVSIHPSQAVLE
jgi:hypothetical protein